MSLADLAALRDTIESQLQNPRPLPGQAWVFGAGGFGQALRRALELQGVRVLGYLTTGDEGVSGDLPVRRLEHGPEGADALFVGVYNHRAASDYGDLAAQLRACGYDAPWWPQESYDRLGNTLGWRYWLAPRADYLARWPSFVEAHGLLADEASRETLRELLRFRLTAPDRPPMPCGEPQYFPALLLACLPGSVVWVDGGAFDGDTLIASQARFPSKLCLAFEPDPIAYGALVAKTAGCSIPTLRLPLGLSDSNGSLSFRGGGGGSGTVDPEGDLRLSFTRLDDVLGQHPIHLLKLDVEGQELAALTGAAGTIRRDRPALALAAYHRWSDIPDLIRHLRTLRDDYRFYLRAHEHNGFDSVLYAV